MATLDFNALKKTYLTVILPDENKTKLLITTPSKTVLDGFIAIKDQLSADELGDEAIDELYEIVAKVLSYNKTKVKITKETIEELFDFEDVIVFLRSYTNFISEVSNSKN